MIYKKTSINGYRVSNKVNTCFKSAQPHQNKD